MKIPAAGKETWALGTRLFDARNESRAFVPLANNVLDRVGSFWVHSDQKMAGRASTGVDLQNVRVSKG